LKNERKTQKKANEQRFCVELRYAPYSLTDNCSELKENMGKLHASVREIEVLSKRTAIQGRFSAGAALDFLSRKVSGLYKFSW